MWNTLIAVSPCFALDNLRDSERHKSTCLFSSYKKKIKRRWESGRNKKNSIYLSDAADGN